MIDIGDLVRFRNHAIRSWGVHARFGRRGEQGVMRVMRREGDSVIVDVLEHRRNNPRYLRYKKVSVFDLRLIRKDKKWFKRHKTAMILQENIGVQLDPPAMPNFPMPPEPPVIPNVAQVWEEL